MEASLYFDYNNASSLAEWTLVPAQAGLGGGGGGGNKGILSVQLLAGASHAGAGSVTDPFSFAFSFATLNAPNLIVGSYPEVLPCPQHASLAPEALVSFAVMPCHEP